MFWKELKKQEKWYLYWWLAFFKQFYSISTIRKKDLKKHLLARKKRFGKKTENKKKLFQVVNFWNGDDKLFGTMLNFLVGCLQKVVLKLKCFSQNILKTLKEHSLSSLKLGSRKSFGEWKPSTLKFVSRSFHQ